MVFSPFDLDRQNEDLDLKIIAALERLGQTFRVLLLNEGKELSLSPIQLQVLIFLLFHDADKRKITYLAEEFNITKASLSDTIRSLEEKGLIRKTPVPEDSRSYIIDLTGNGKSIAQRASLFTDELKTPIHQLSADDKQNLLISLIRIIHHLQQAGVISIQRMCLTCAHYRKGHQGHSHYCSLLNQGLAEKELRIDCAEHSITG